MNFNLKLGAAVATATFLATVLAPAGLAETNVNVTNTGVNATNNINVNNTSKTVVTLTNENEVSTGVTAVSDTGNNKANNNTGGDVAIVSGNASADVNVTVGGPSNTVNQSDCGCGPADTNVDVNNTGVGGKNKITVSNPVIKKVTFTNLNSILSSLLAKAKTGKNTANNNDGGTTSIITSDSTTNVTVKVSGPSNTLNP